jgi:hypothetical protein
MIRAKSENTKIITLRAPEAPRVVEKKTQCALRSKSTGFSAKKNRAQILKNEGGQLCRPGFFNIAR